MGKGASEEAGEAGGSRILTPAPPINPRNAREVAGRLFTGFGSLRGATKALESFVRKPWSRSYESPGVVRSPDGPLEGKRKLWS